MRRLRIGGLVAVLGLVTLVVGASGPSASIGVTTMTSLVDVGGFTDYGGVVTLTARLFVVATNTEVPGKTISFSIGSTAVCGRDAAQPCPQTDVLGYAELHLSALPAGYTDANTYPNAVTATFAGDSSYAGSSVTGPLVVAKTDLSVVADDQTMTYGGSVPTFTATGYGLANGDTIGSLGGSCIASVDDVSVTSSTPAGVYPGAITCSGVSTANYKVSYQAGKLTINPATTTTSVTSNVNPSTLGQTVTFTARVSPEYSGTPDGTVTFYDNGTAIGTGTLADGQTTLTSDSLSLGSHTITALYVPAGGSYFLSSLSLSLTEYVDSDLSQYPSLSNINLKGASLGGADLSGDNLSNSNLEGVDFSGADLTGVDLTNANLKDAVFTGADLTGADLTGANLKGATGLADATLTGVTWSKTACPDGTDSSKDGGTCVNNLS